MTTWYNPQEIRDQADGDQIDPEFDPPATPDYDDVETNEDPAVTALIERADVIAAIIADEITNDPEAAS
jgi:hypothetical protein